MADDEAAKLIKKTCMHGDTEMAHGDADDILLSVLSSLGYAKTVEAWQEVDKWYA